MNFSTKKPKSPFASARPVFSGEPTHDFLGINIGNIVEGKVQTVFAAGTNAITDKLTKDYLPVTSCEDAVRKINELAEKDKTAGSLDKIAISRIMPQLSEYLTLNCVEKKPEPSLTDILKSADPLSQPEAKSFFQRNKVTLAVIAGVVIVGTCGLIIYKSRH